MLPRKGFVCSFFTALHAHLSPRTAYRRYVAHQQLHHPDSHLLSFAEFYRTELDRKWQKVQRCC